MDTSRNFIMVIAAISTITSCECVKQHSSPQQQKEAIDIDNSSTQISINCARNNDEQIDDSQMVTLSATPIEFVNTPTFYLLSGKTGGEDNCERIEGAEVLQKKTISNNLEELGLFISCMNNLKDAPKKDCMFLPDMAISFIAKGIFSEGKEEAITISYSFYCDVFRVRCANINGEYQDTDAELWDKKRLRRIMIDVAYATFPKDRYIQNLYFNK